MAAAAGADEGEVEGEDESSPPAMTPEQIEEFFRNTMERLTSPEEREIIKSKVQGRTLSRNGMKERGQ